MVAGIDCDWRQRLDVVNDTALLSPRWDVRPLRNDDTIRQADDLRVRVKIQAERSSQRHDRAQR